MARERLSMRKTTEILRLKHEAGLTNRQIARSCGVTHTTVANYLERVGNAGLGWPLPEGLDEERLQELLFPDAGGCQPSRVLPDMEQTHKDLRRKHVTVNRKEIERVVADLQKTLEDATREDLRGIMQEQIAEIRIPKTGKAQLEPDPAGLLKRRFVLVTPRGVEPPSQE